MKRPPRPTAHRHAGLTLVEALVGVAVLGILLAVATPSLNDWIERRRVIAITSEIVSIFNYAKSETNVVEGDLIMHMEPVTQGEVSCLLLVTLSSIDTCSCAQASSRKCEGSSSKRLRELVLAKDSGVSFEATGNWSDGGINYVVPFSRNRRYTDFSNVQLDVKGRRSGAQMRVEYNNVGRLRICSPEGSMGGYPAC